MSLIRFENGNERGPSAALWQGLVDWVRGSLAATLGQRDYEDFTPFLGFAEVSNTDGAVGANGGMQVTAADDAPVVALQTDRFGVVNFSTAAGADETVALARELWYDLQSSPLVVIETRVEQIADADEPQLFVGFFDGADPDDVFAAGVIASTGGQDAIGLLWNINETIDIVAVDNGTLTVLKDDIGVTLLRSDGPANLGLRIERMNSTTYRLTPCVNGAIARAGAVTVAATLLPENPMRPVVADTVDATTDPEMEVDWIFSADK
jgi:hypothetical protein